MTTLTLDRMPGTTTAYLAAAAGGLRRPDAEVEIPALDVQVGPQPVPAERLARYRELCGYPESPVLPIAFAQVMAAPLQIHLMTRKEFPLPLLGLVHLRNEIVQQQPLPADQPLSFRVSIAGSRPSKHGLEFDLVTQVVRDDGATPWRAVATILYRSGKAPSGSGRKAPPAEPPAALVEYVNFEAPADIGRRYGRVSGDINPIHLHPLSARLFGFKRAIAHGMWSMARCEAALEERLGRAPQKLTTEFKRPLYLPARVALKFTPDGAAIGFSLLNRDTPDTHLTGHLS